MNTASPLLQGWQVRTIKVVHNGRVVDVEFTIAGRSPFRFRTRKFGVGGRNARTAALARFASKAGFGELHLVFSYLSKMRRDHEGNVFPLGPLGRILDDPSVWGPKNLYPEYCFAEDDVVTALAGAVEVPNAHP